NQGTVESHTLPYSSAEDSLIDTIHCSRTVFGEGKTRSEVSKDKQAMDQCTNTTNTVANLQFDNSLMLFHSCEAEKQVSWFSVVLFTLLSCGSGAKEQTVKVEYERSNHMRISGGWESQVKKESNKCLSARQAACAGSEGGLQRRFVYIGECGDPAVTFLSAVCRVEGNRTHMSVV
ncbi:hypothetical protein Nmel_006969, partial [Mimus melanotis]